MLEVALAYNDIHILAAQSIREDVFVKEQGVAKEIDRDGLDVTSRHLIALYNYEPVGCARIRFIDEKRMKLERLAVMATFRGKGIGKALVESSIKHAKEEGRSEIFMHAQVYLKDYYKKMGFIQRGEEFLEANIPHVEMYLVI